MKQYRCPDCDGQGEIYTYGYYPPMSEDGYWKDCALCNARGFIEEVDWLILKLAGEVT